MAKSECHILFHGIYLDLSCVFILDEGMLWTIHFCKVRAWKEDSSSLSVLMLKEHFHWVTTDVLPLQALWTGQSPAVPQQHEEPWFTLSHTDCWSLSDWFTWLQLRLLESVLSFPQGTSISLCIIFKASWLTCFIMYALQLATVENGSCCVGLWFHSRFFFYSGLYPKVLGKLVSLCTWCI